MQNIFAHNDIYPLIIWLKKLNKIIYPTIDFPAHDDTGILLSEYNQSELLKSAAVNVSAKKYS